MPHPGKPENSSRTAPPENRLNVKQFSTTAQIGQIHKKKC